MICYVCRDKGMLMGCPNCGKEKNFSGNESVELTKDVMDKLYIPNYYQCVNWSSDKLRKELPDLNTHRLFNQYIDQLDKIYNIFESGQLPNKSILITAPPKRGKQIWAFSCMKQALRHGYTVSPILDTSEWRRLNIIATERAYIKDMALYGCTLEQMITNDVVILSVDHDNFKGAYRAIQTLIDKRQRRGKATIVISRYTPEQISILDFDKDFKQAFDRTSKLNPCKYLGYIQGE